MRQVPENRRWPGETFFVTGRLLSTHRDFSETPAAQLACATLQFYRQRGDIRLYGYVVMPDHLHLLIKMSELQTLSPFMNRFKSYIGHELHRGPIWQEGFWSEIIARRYLYYQKLNYIHRNPVEAGIAERPEDYPWSSAREYSLIHESTVIDYY